VATVSSHTLDSLRGTHAGGIVVTLDRIDPDGARTRVFESATDEGGRLSQTVTVAPGHLPAHYEMVLQTGAYFAARGQPPGGMQILDEVVIRFRMPDPQARYHIPLMLAPNSYSVWWSS